MHGASFYKLKTALGRQKIIFAYLRHLSVENSFSNISVTIRMKSAYDSTLRRILYAETWQSIKYRLMWLFHAQTRNGAMYEAKFGRDGAMYEFFENS